MLFLNLNFTTFVIFFAVCDALPQKIETGYSVIIVVGSGISGISSARALQNKGYKVVVLEARDRYGGRIWSNKEAFGGSIGMEVDMGASWICNDDNKTIGMQLSHKLKIPTVFSSFLWPKAYYSNHTSISEKRFKAILKSYYKMLFLQLPKNVNSLMYNEKDASLKAVLQRSAKFKRLLSNPIFALLNSHLVEADIGAGFSMASVLQFTNISAKNTRVIPSGYSSILEPLVRGLNEDEVALDIRYDQEVISIIANQGQSISVLTKTGQKYEGRAVILTVPLGVLKSQTIKFIPPLPPSISRAISNLGFGNMNKIHIKFDRVFWPKEMHTFGFIPDISNGDSTLPDASFYHSWLNGHFYTGQAVLIGFATGKSADISENMTDPELLNIALTNLGKMFGTKEVSQAKVVGMIRSKWASDPYARGTWTYPAIGSSEKELLAFSNSSGPLFFAGEHTNPQQLGTVSGAYASGLRAAQETENYLAKLAQEQK